MNEGMENLKEIEELFSTLKKYKLDKYVKLDLSVMRGFDYYTSTVFEAYDKKGEFRAIAGGGRYDNLAGIPGIGYGFGDLVLEAFLKEKNLLPKTKNSTQLLIIPIKTLDKCIPIAEKLRESLNVSIDLQNRDLSKNLDYADKQSIPYVLIIGEDEIKEKKVKLKNMETGKEKAISIENVIKECQL